MRLRVIDGSGTSFEVMHAADVVRIGRSPSCELVFDAAKFPKVSSCHAEIRREGDKTWLVHLSRSNKTLLNSNPVESRSIVDTGDHIRLGFTGPIIEIISLESPGIELPSAKLASAASETLLGVRSSELMPSQHVKSFAIQSGGIIGRDQARVKFLLDHPQVSRLHAKLSVDASETSIVDLGSANGTFRNGIQIKHKQRLQVGDVIDIGPYSLHFDGHNLGTESRKNNSQLTAINIGFSVQDRESRKPIQLLDGVSFILNPGEFLCLLGPSGSGKSTLLNIVSGRRRASSGSVYLNARDLHSNFGALKQDIAVVPQATLLHEKLSVQQTLTYTSKLRLPPDSNSAEITENVNSILEVVGLGHRRNVPIHQLSGGQLKRAGLGCELLSDPSLLFLDEVTSGLDEHSDGEMMSLFRKLADSGKSLVCITHNLGNVETYCNLIAVLTVGGRLAFLGTPLEAKRYFGCNSLSDIYTCLQNKAPEDWAESFLQSQYFQRYVLDRSPGITSSRESARENVFNPLPAALRQFSVLTSRTVAVWTQNLPALVALFGQALLVTILLCLVFGGVPASEVARVPKIQNLLFMLNISSFWMGCNNAVKEIVKERRIFERERNYNLLPESYLASKFVFLCFIGLLQTLLLGFVTLYWFDMPGQRLEMIGILVLLSVAGTCLGLALSANSRTEELAVALVPASIIPQIVLAGVVANLPSLAELIAKLSITAYWGQRTLNSFLPKNDQFVFGDETSVVFAVCILITHTLVFASLAWIGVRNRKA